MSSFPVSPARMSVTNLVTLESIEAQFNPTEFTEGLGAAYARQAIQGLSHQVKQFSNTEDLVVDLTLFFTSVDGGPALQDRIESHRRFLMALCYPRPTAGAVKSAGAPRALFSWPGFIALTTVVTKLKFHYQRFNVEGRPVAFTAQLTLEEIRDALITSDVVRDIGSNRTTGKKG